MGRIHAGVILAHVHLARPIASMHQRSAGPPVVRNFARGSGEDASFGLCPPT